MIRQKKASVVINFLHWCSKYSLPTIITTLILTANFISSKWDEAELLKALCSVILISFFFGQRRTSVRIKYLLFFLSAISFSFYFPISNTFRWILVAISVLLLTQVKDFITLEKIQMKDLRNAVLLYTFFNLVRFLLESKINYVIQFLSYGYDNALHLSLFKGYLVTSWYPSLKPSSWASDFTLFQNYPSGQAAIYSFAGNIFGKSNFSTDSVICNFFLMELLTLLGIMFLIYLIIRPLHKGKSIILKVSLFAISLLIGITYPGIYLSNGFPPYLMGTFIVLGYALLVPSLGESQKPLITLLVVCLLNLVCPAFIFCILVPGVFYIISRIYFVSRTNQLKELFIITVASVSALVFIYKVNTSTVSHFGWKIILSAGGIQNPNVILGFMVLLIFYTTNVIHWRHSLNDPLTLIAWSSILGTTLLASINYAYTQKVQYYAIKEAYVALLLCSLSSVRVLLINKGIRSSSWRSGYIPVLLFGCAMFAFQPILEASNSSNGFMSTFGNAAKADLNQPNWRLSYINADVLLSARSALGLNTKSKCILLRAAGHDSDLNSRWMNAISDIKTFDNNCFLTYWNSNMLTDEKFFAKIANTSEKLSLLLPKNEPLLFDFSKTHITVLRY